MAFQSPRTVAKPGRVATKFLVGKMGLVTSISVDYTHWSSGVSHDEVLRTERQAASQGAKSG